MPDATEQMEQLYRDTAPLLHAYFVRHGAASEAARDLVQETFQRALRHPERLAKAISPRAFLFGIARHVGIDAHRKAPPETLELSQEHHGSQTSDPRWADVRTAIEALPDIHRETLLLKTQQGLSYAEIATALSLPIGTVRSRLHNAVRQLRNTLTNDQP